VPRYDVPKAAPAPLNVVQAFVNTVDLENKREWLATPNDLAQWFEEKGITASPRGPSGLRRAHELRDAFRVLLIANREGEEPAEDALGVINKSARGLRAAVGADLEISWTAADKRADSGLTELVEIAFASILDGTWPRLKACRNCRWAFFDYSRNRTARWCSMTLCGNRQKTRRYRKRRKGS
jgi:predicted RNA-binding Zn ribbon-like protein